MVPDYSESAAKRMEEMEEPTMAPEGFEFEQDYVVKLGGQAIDMDGAV